MKSQEFDVLPPFLCRARQPATQPDSSFIDFIIFHFMSRLFSEVFTQFLHSICSLDESCRVVSVVFCTRPLNPRHDDISRVWMITYVNKPINSRKINASFNVFSLTKAVRSNSCFSIIFPSGCCFGAVCTNLSLFPRIFPFLRVCFWSREIVQIEGLGKGDGGRWRNHFQLSEKKRQDNLATDFHFLGPLPEKSVRT